MKPRKLGGTNALCNVAACELIDCVRPGADTCIRQTSCTMARWARVQHWQHRSRLLSVLVR